MVPSENVKVYSWISARVVKGPTVRSLSWMKVMGLAVVSPSRVTGAMSVKMKADVVGDSVKEVVS